MRIFLATATLFIIFNTSTLAQDSLFWERYDTHVDSLIRVADTWEDALAAVTPILSTCRKSMAISEDLAYRYHKIALVFRRHLPFAVKSYADTAIQLRTEAQVTKADIAQSMYERGRIYTMMSRHQSALADFQAANTLMEEALEESSTPEIKADVARRLAYFYREAARSGRQNGNFGLADLWLDKIPALQRLHHHPRTAYLALMTRGDIHNDAGRYEEAITVYKSLREHPFHAEISPVFEAVVTNNIGVLYNRMGKPLLAKPKLEFALSSNKARKNRTNIAFTCSSLLKTHNLLREFDEAKNMLKEGLEASSLAYPTGKAAVIGELYARGANTLTLQNDFSGADSLLRLGFMGVMDVPNLSGPAELPIIEGSTIYSVEELMEVLSAKRMSYVSAFDQGANPAGLDLALLTTNKIDTLLRRSRSELSLTSSLAALFRLENKEYSKAIDLALRLYRLKQDESYLEAAYRFAAGQKSSLLRRYLTSPSLAANLGVPEGIIAQKSALEIKIAATESALSTAKKGEAGALRDSLLSLRGREVHLRHQIAADHPAFDRALRGLPNIEPAVAAASLAADQLVIEYFLGVDSVYIFSLDAKQGLSVEVVNRPTDINGLVNEVLSSGPGATRLYDLLVAPVLEDRPGISRIQIIPDGDLWKIPFAALRRDDHFLIEDVAVSFAYAAPLIFNPPLAEVAAKGEAPYLGFGISYEDILQRISSSGNRDTDVAELRNMGRLPWASKEVIEAAAIMEGPYLLDADATKPRFLAEASRTNILHLAMHGLIREDPMKSALVFRGEGEQDVALLTMAEVLSSKYATDLTLLSACHTGGGPVSTSEGMLSIGRAFTAAGSRATITSTWEARDDAAYQIFIAFYQNLHDGSPKDVALQQAILAYLSAGTATDRQPVNWANLVLTGEVAPLSNNGLSWFYYWVGGLLLTAVALFWFRHRSA